MEGDLGEKIWKVVLMHSLSKLESQISINIIKWILSIEDSNNESDKVAVAERVNHQSKLGNPLKLRPIEKSSRIFDKTNPVILFQISLYTSVELSGDQLQLHMAIGVSSLGDFQNQVKWSTITFKHLDDGRWVEGCEMEG